jgi:predicted AAA+ superfamily ATPase
MVQITEKHCNHKEFLYNGGEVDRMKGYRKRIADQVLKDKLEAKGAVLIEGPKWCGKTTTATQIAKSTLYIQDPARKAQNLKMAELEPALLLDGETPRLIDEWQLAPQLWDAVRFEVDKRDEFGQFILTGSSTTVGDMTTSHSGTGRISRMNMRPMTLYESGDSSGSVSLGELFREQKTLAVKSELDIRRIAYLICRGGWPKSLDQPEKIALRQAYDYFLIQDSSLQMPGLQKSRQTWFSMIMIHWMTIRFCRISML